MTRCAFLRLSRSPAYTSILLQYPPRHLSKKNRRQPDQRWLVGPLHIYKIPSTRKMYQGTCIRVTVCINGRKRSSSRMLNISHRTHIRRLFRGTLVSSAIHRALLLRDVKPIHTCKEKNPVDLLLRDLNLPALNVITDILWTSSIDLATDTERCTENLLHTTLQLLGKRLKSHCSGDFDDLVKGNGFAVFDVFLLLAIPRRFLQGFNDERRS